MVTHIPYLWRFRLLLKLHAKQRRSNYRLLHEWAACEGGDAANNPLNTTEPWPGATNYNDVGVKNYPTGADGIQATYLTLTNGHYPGIVAGLRDAIKPSIIIDKYASEFDTWGTGTVCLKRAFD